MPSIDLSQFDLKRKDKPKSEKDQLSGILELLNRDISFNGNQLPDKKKEYLYLELSSLLKAGIDFKAAFELIKSDQKKAKDKNLFDKIHRDVIGGLSFSAALKGTGRFSAYEIYSLEIGEETGKVNPILEDLAKFYQRKIKQQRKIVSALTYPSIVIATSFGVVYFMMKFVVPMFSDIFKRYGGELPAITRHLISISNLFQDNGSIMILLIVVFGAAVITLRGNEVFQRFSSALVIRIPLVGNLVKKIYLARFCNAMRLLINAKLPLLRALELSKQMVGYYPIVSTLPAIEQQILKGETLHKSMQRFKIYPNKMIQLLKVGEETNQLDYFFEKIAEQYIDEVEYKTATLSSAMEPFIILFLGVVVGLIVIAIYLPLFQLSNSFQ
jgi:type IV pilus assembly protein PilC